MTDYKDESNCDLKMIRDVHGHSAERNVTGQAQPNKGLSSR